ncbi:LapA family protein [Dethiobacter alkaliphilus]|uniref:LapA family protein n=1 Tax=Dethiobacter alkaliphilus TaxID=427926 RepID=UPI002227E08F|nr:LapA family protein [Dethiobacter alkaliphilus]MCW3491275.1 LapA family protein [Dethiobacter alkaliphilus]
MQLGVIVGLVFGVIIAFFAMLNTETIIVNYFFGQVYASVAIVVLGSALAGALAVGMFGLVTKIRTGFAFWDYQNRVERLAKEVAQLQEQKKALSDDLSYVNAECEEILRQKEIELAECEEEAAQQEVAAEATDQQEIVEEEKKDDN